MFKQDEITATTCLKATLNKTTIIHFLDENNISELIKTACKESTLFAGT